MTVIAGVETQSVRASDKTVWRHLLIRDDDGNIGLGEYTISGADDQLDATAQRFAAPLVGENIASVAGPALAARWGGDFVAWAIASGVDQAVCDLAARRAGATLAHTLRDGAGSGPVAIYANINRRTAPRTPAGFAASARDALAAGNTAIKLAPFDDLTPALCANGEGEALIAAGVERIAAVADACGGGAAVMVDCHWRLSPARAMAVIDDMADLGVAWFECPIPETPDAVPALRRLRSRCADKGMRLAGCEKMNGLAQFQPFIDGEAYDVIMPDVKYAGGLRETLRIAEAVAGTGIGCSIHNPSGPVAHLMSVHATAAMGGDERLETQFDEAPAFWNTTTPAPEFGAGTALLADAPGIGVTLNETA